MSVASKCKDSKSLIFAILTFRHSPHALKALRSVALLFQSMFVWMVFVWQSKYTRVAPSSGAEFLSNDGNGETSGTVEAGGSSEVVMSTGKTGFSKVLEKRFRMRAIHADVRRRRALAGSVRSKRQVDESILCWQTHLFVNERGQTLFTQSWFPNKTLDIKGLVVVVHGLNEHSGRYINFASQLNSQGFGVYAMDWIGHGGSDGLHGYVSSLDHVVADVKAYLEWITKKHPEVPCFLFGHSTGGAVVLKAASYPSVERMLKGVILTSPALRVRPAHPMVGVVAPLFSIFIPTLQFKGANRRGIPVSRDPAELVAKYSDPLVYTGPIRVRTGSEILRITSYLQRNMKRITVPFLLLHGTADRVTDPEASEDFYNLAASKHKRLKLYEGFLHDLLFEPEREEVTWDIIGWLEELLEAS